MAAKRFSQMRPSLFVLCIFIPILSSCQRRVDPAIQAQHYYIERYKALKRQWKSESAKIYAKVSSCKLDSRQAHEALSKRQDYYLDRYINVDYDPRELDRLRKSANCA